MEILGELLLPILQDDEFNKETQRIAMRFLYVSCQTAKCTIHFLYASIYIHRLKHAELCQIPCFDQVSREAQREFPQCAA